MDAVIYHGNCYDGFGAAWAARQKLGDKASYHAALYGQPVPDLSHVDGYVYLLDFSYPSDVLVRLVKDGHMVVVIDHHKTAQQDLRMLEGFPGVGITFDLTQSGAMLAWKHFHGPAQPPVLINYVQDRDLWRFALPCSREVHAWLRSYPFDYELWDDLAMTLHTDLTSCAEEGKAILRSADRQVDEMLRYTRLYELMWPREPGATPDWIRVPVVNATVYFSEVGDALCRAFPDAPFSAYYVDRADVRQWGLRSRGGFDVSAVAKGYGGGGHPAAAGFQTRIGEIPWRPATT